MAQIGADWVLLFTCSAFFGVIAYNQSDGQTILKVALKSLFAFGLLAFFIQLLSPVITRAISKLKPEKVAENKYKSLSSEEIKKRQEKARESIQTAHSEKSDVYYENITKPREEAKQAQKEKDFYKFMGPAWKGEGEKLGSCEEHGEVRNTSKHGSGREAAEARKPLNVSTGHDSSAPDKRVKPKKVIELPEEPPEGAAGSVTVALRTPLGKTFKRRFMCSDKIQIILDYMTKIGYNQRLYSVVTSYPRHCLSAESEKTLEQLGINRDVVLNVEEKDWDNLDTD